MNREKCFRCGKELDNFYELMDTKDNRKIRLCEECGELVANVIKEVKQ